MKVTKEHIFHDDADPTGFDIIVEASEIGIGPVWESPPPIVEIEMPAGDTLEFHIAGSVREAAAVGGRFLYWSYWNTGFGTAINLKVLND